MSGDEIQSEFLALVDANRQKVLRICRVYAWTPHDQEDLYQEVLVQIWRALPTLQDKSLANTWLYRVTLNTAMSFARKKSAEHRASQLGSDELARQIEERHRHADGTNPRLELLYESVGQLNDVEKAAVTMFLDDLSYEEIGGVLGIAPGHAGVLLHRAKKKLAVLMKEVSE